MCKVINNKVNKQTSKAPGFGVNLDTLAQLPTDGVKINLGKRARSKFYNNKIVAPLLYIETPLHKQYNRAFHCNDILMQEGKTITGRYCNSRICNVCNRIRTAKFMNGYSKPLMDLGRLEFVTLTIPNCSAQDLKKTVGDMCKNFTNILRVIRERHKVKISGIRKIEVTYNSKENTYHPHLHIMIDKRQGAELIAQWMDRYPSASRKGQDTRPVNKSSFNELFKYNTKILAKAGKGFSIYATALDVIMQALHKRRTFQTFGAVKKVKISEDITELQSFEAEGIEATEFKKEWRYDEYLADWYAFGETKPLTGYKPPDIEFTVFI